MDKSVFKPHQIGAVTLRQIRYVTEGLGGTLIDGAARELIPGTLAARPAPSSLLAKRAAGVYHSTDRYASQAVIQFMGTACGVSTARQE